MKKHGYEEKKLQLLNDISGVFKPRGLTALMGVTGAGKTTLLDVLAGRKTRGYVEGSINISGYEDKQETFSRVATYCEQTDIHSPFLTVKESLQFSAWLRLPSNIEAKKRNVSQSRLNFVKTTTDTTDSSYSTISIFKVKIC